MPKVLIIQQVFNSREWMDLVYPAMANQTFKDSQIVAQIVSDDGGCEDYIRKNFPEIIILKPGYNIGFARGHNEIFVSTNAEFYQLVNPDLILEPDYVEEMVKAMEQNPGLGAATGKLLQYNFVDRQKTNTLDTTGVVVSKSGRARDRGQHQKDSGQYNSLINIVGVSGAGPMYRKSALEAVKYPLAHGRYEYFDEDFHSYWEDVDLSLRLQNLGFSSVFVPAAMGYHGRTAGSSKEGYKNIKAFVKHHKIFSSWVKQLNYKNHIFMVIKNFPRFYLKFFVREFFMFGYIVIFETRTLKIIPTFWRQLPLMWKKRKWIQKHRENAEWLSLLNNEDLLS